MAIQFNIQGLVDAMTQQMIEDKDPVIKAARKNVVIQLSNPVREAIQYHSEAIKSLKAEANGEVINQKAISYHESQLEFYQS